MDKIIPTIGSSMLSVDTLTGLVSLIPLKKARKLNIVTIVSEIAGVQALKAKLKYKLPVINPILKNEIEANKLAKAIVSTKLISSSK